jgi:hypothetical protein
MKIHKDLDVYNLSIDLITNVYSLTNNFPKEELFGLTSQVRRSAVSIPTNIAEGSASELDTLILIAHKLGYITQEGYNNFILKLTSVSKMLQGLIKSVKSNSN